MFSFARSCSFLLVGIVVVGAGAVALSSSACKMTPDYPYESCARDTDCSSAKICRGGRCEQVDLTCTTDGDCVGGRLCVKAMCQHPVCQDDRGCAAGERCISGFCSLPNSELPPDQDGGAPKDAPATDAPASETPAKERVTPANCTPNDNGQIERNEMLFKLGTSSSYEVAGSANSPILINLNGIRGNDGVITWDFSQKFPNNGKVVEEVLSVSGTWYKNLYPEATHAVILERNLKFFGVFQVTNTDLLLMGLASEGKDSTKLKYDTPISLFKFPLAVGKKWTTSGTTSGTLNNVPFYKMHETYLFEVDAKGKAKTPAGTFPVVRLKLHLTQQQYSPSFFRRTGFSYYFVAECRGVLLTIDSKAYETNPLFTQASFIKRLHE